ncbi:hypothetical protein MMC25_004533 [Agyrium rufum]|nr:hypothetical protein [Agyrium rufum]
MEKSTKPIFFIVQGTMHVPEHWAPFQAKLTAEGYQSRCIALPEIGANARTSPEYDNVNAIQEELKKLVIKEGKEVIVVLHSAGGNPGSQAIKGLERTFQKSQGNPSGIIGIVFIAAFLIPEGSNLAMAAAGGQLPNWAEPDAKTVRPSAATGELLFSDLPKSEQEHWYSLLEPHAVHGAISPVRNACWGLDVPKMFVITTNDKVATVEWQENMLMAVDNGTWTIERLHSDHSPFLTHQKELVNLLKQAIPSSA